MDSSQPWLNASDRGGLIHISDVGLDLFVEIEVFVYDHLMEKDVRDMDTLKFMACEDPDILSIWSHLEEIDDISTDVATTMQSSLLVDIIQEWIKIRGHSIASIEIEKYKKGKAITKKSLHKGLKQKSTSTE